jgi:hypothetical protein
MTHQRRALRSVATAPARAAVTVRASTLIFVSSGPGSAICNHCEQRCKASRNEESNGHYEASAIVVLRVGAWVGVSRGVAGPPRRKTIRTTDHKPPCPKFAVFL